MIFAPRNGSDQKKGSTEEDRKKERKTDCKVLLLYCRRSSLTPRISHASPASLVGASCGSRLAGRGPSAAEATGKCTGDEGLMPRW